MATLNLRTPIQVRFKDTDEASKYGCDATVVKFPAGSHVVPDELMDHAYIKAAHVEARKPKMGQAGRQGVAPQPMLVKPETPNTEKPAQEPVQGAVVQELPVNTEAGNDEGGQRQEPPKALDDMTYPEMKAAYSEQFKKDPPNNVKKADLQEALSSGKAID